MEINKKLKSLRLKNGYSKLFVSQKLGYKSNVLVRKEKGQRAFSVDDIQKLCTLYHVSPNYLLMDEITEISGGADNEENISNKQ
ncbi:XRE family transcriptional regulator [Clostridioides difficile]|nr:XRE family transcriptional regulator [Clostridioides difficile]